MLKLICFFLSRHIPPNNNKMASLYLTSIRKPNFGPILLFELGPSYGIYCTFCSGAPDSPNQILSFISEVHTFYIQQRTMIRPVIVHCRWVFGLNVSAQIRFKGFPQRLENLDNETRNKKWSWRSHGTCKIGKKIWEFCGLS